MWYHFSISDRLFAAIFVSQDIVLEGVRLRISQVVWLNLQRNFETLKVMSTHFVQPRIINLIGMVTKLPSGCVGKGENVNNFTDDTKIVNLLLNKHIHYGQLAHLPPIDESLYGSHSSVVSAIEEFRKSCYVSQPDGQADADD